MTAFSSTELLDRRRHRVQNFSCGKQALDIWLQRYASQGQRRDTARTFVSARSNGAVAGYYTLVAGQVDHGAATTEVGAGASSRFPIPVALIARLAVDACEHGKGLGAALLLDALERIVAASELVGIRAVVVHAIDDAAAAFYKRFAFEALADDPRTLMVPVSAVRDVLTASRQR